MRLRLLPWRPRVRGRDRFKDRDWDLFDVGGDDPISAILLGLVLVLLLPFVVVLLVFSLELALLAVLLPLALVGQLLNVLPWVLVVRYADGTKRYVEVRGTRAMLEARRKLRPVS